MSETDKTAIAALLYVTMRRTANRIIDVEWLGKHEEYAREIIQLARRQGTEELTRYADRYEELTFGKSVAAESPPPPENISADGSGPEDDRSGSPGRYIGSLR